MNEIFNSFNTENYYTNEKFTKFPDKSLLSIIKCSKIRIIDNYNKDLDRATTKTIALDANGKTLTSATSKLKQITIFDLKDEGIQTGLQFKVIAFFILHRYGRSILIEDRSKVIIEYDPTSTKELNFELTNNFKLVLKD